MIGKHVVYIENRNGNSPAHVLQHETIDRMLKLLYICLLNGFSLGRMNKLNASSSH